MAYSSSASVFSVYANGVFVSSVTGTLDLNDFGSITLGCRDNGSECYYGSLYDVRVSSVVRYTENFIPAPMEPGPDTVALYKLSETGPINFDSSGNGNHLAITGNPNAVRIDVRLHKSSATAINSIEGGP